MRLVKFLLKFVFICNLCYLAGWLLRMTEQSGDLSPVFKHMVVLGYLVALPANIITSLLAIILLLARKVSWAELPGYLLILNLIILIVQILV
ncbi:hypothetical protein LX66_4142 [Chitinophaga japonensis]|uniref:Uncharacterized protein n=1 Tax=Chitinophaga japonensis TaxID=104662 RepID=A0A562T006_CHIJA|nr:hypothetical protein LX66_4142 [Chitinophaga japonensis]